MKSLEINLENCYGIKKLENHKFSFENSNVNLIYAKNGSMKTSFAKVFQMLQTGKPADKKKIRDNIFDKDGEYKIEIGDNKIAKDDIFVIPSFESAYESKNLANLLIDDDLKKELEKTLAIKKEFIYYLAKQSGFEKKVNEMENQLREDFKIQNFLPEINSDIFDTSLLKEDFSMVSYKNIFDSESVILKPEFQDNIKLFITEMKSIYKTFTFIKPREFSLGKIKKVSKELNDNNFFVGDNSVNLDGITGAIKDLPEQIEKVEIAIEDNKKLKKIKKALETVGGVKLLEEIEKGGVEIVPYLAEEKLPELRKKIWLSYIFKNITNFESLKQSFKEFEKKSDKKSFKETSFNEVYSIFKDRFTVPFEMDIENKDSCILAESPPKIIFKFKNPETGSYDISPHSRKKIEENILSQGEKRALYLLNIIFEIENFKRQLKLGEIKQKLFIIDDIADSFDYKNKYAIIEYLRDITEYEFENESGVKIKPFYSIILTHNFDFYRTLSSRLSMARDNKFHVRVDKDNQVYIEKEHYQNNPFDLWKNVLKERKYKKIDYSKIDAQKHILALIPFVRNLIEYGVDKGENSFSGIEKDSLFLTHLLHKKDNTKDIKISHLKKIYAIYLDKNDFDKNISDKLSIYEMLTDIADNHISDDDHKLENKIILAIAIRLEAEKFMKNEIETSSYTFSWEEGRGKEKKYKTGTYSDFLKFIESSTNQTFQLFNGYKQIGDSGKIKILEEVNIMTPENIHLNSFMYEPILDMDIANLKKLYEKVKDLNKK